MVAAAAHRVAAHDPAVAAHPWLSRATDYCVDAIRNMNDAPFAYVLAFSVRLLDAVGDRLPGELDPLLKRLSSFVPPGGKVPVRGGAEDEMLHPLDLAPDPAGPARRLFGDDVIAADLDRLAGLQQDDGGWVVDYRTISPAGTLEWRGHATVRAIGILRRNAGS